MSHEHDENLLSGLRRVDEICDEFERSFVSGGDLEIAGFLGRVPIALRLPLLKLLLPVAIELQYRADRLRPLEEYEATLNCPGETVARIYNATVAQIERESPTHPASLQRNLTESTDQLPQICGYQILRQIGKGGMGVVYLAKQVHLDKHVALKVLPLSSDVSDDSVRRFRREMLAVGKLSHPNIVAACDAGEATGHLYLAMEYVDGIDFSKSTTGIRHTDACEIVRQAAIGLQHAHEHGFVHRDVKPSNLILSSSGQVKVVDFGLSKLSADAPLHDELTREDQVLGTLRYMAPEHFEDSQHADIRSDIYSLGLTFYFLLTGRRPNPGESFTSVSAKTLSLFAESRRPDYSWTRIPPKLKAIFARMTAKDPEDRFSKPSEVIEAITLFCSGHDLVALYAQLQEVRNSKLPLTSSVRNKERSKGKPLLRRTGGQSRTPTSRRNRMSNRFWPSIVSPCLLLLAAIAYFAFFGSGRNEGLSTATPVSLDQDDDIDNRSAPEASPATSQPAEEDVTFPVSNRRVSKNLLVGPEDGMYQTIVDAIAAAQPEETIEIRTNEPLVEPRPIHKQLTGTLRIRAGDGFRPLVIRPPDPAGPFLRFTQSDTATACHLELDGVSFVNVTHANPNGTGAQHGTLSIGCSFEINRCAFFTTSGCLFAFMPDQHSEGVIRNCYIRGIVHEIEYYTDLITLGTGKVTVQNNLLIGGRVAFAMGASLPTSRADGYTELVCENNTVFACKHYCSIDGPSVIKSRNNVFLHHAGSHFAKVTIDTKEMQTLQNAITYEGLGNVYRDVNWGIFPGHFREGRGMEAWQVITQSGEHGARLDDGGPRSEKVMHELWSRIHEPEAFDFGDEAGADVSQLPGTPGQVHAVIHLRQQ